MPLILKRLQNAHTIFESALTPMPIRCFVDDNYFYMRGSAKRNKPSREGVLYTEKKFRVIFALVGLLYQKSKNAQNIE